MGGQVHTRFLSPKESSIRPTLGHSLASDLKIHLVLSSSDKMPRPDKRRGEGGLLPRVRPVPVTGEDLLQRVRRSLDRVVESVNLTLLNGPESKKIRNQYMYIVQVCVSQISHLTSFRMLMRASQNLSSSALSSLSVGSKRRKSKH